MDAAQQEATARARELQRNWYGEPLGALFRKLIDDLGLNQARLAGVLGLSAPMLSQLMSGQRAKIGNPAVVQRVQLLQELAAQVADGSVSAAEATERMDEIKRSQGGSVLSNATQSTTSPTDRTIARSVRRLMVNPATIIRKTAPMSEIGMATTGMMTARKDPRNRKITTMTISSVSLSVLMTSLMASWMYSVES